MLKRLAMQSSHYAIGSALVTLASVISFPVLTRLLTVQEYGTLSLLASLLLLFTGLGKLGMQHSIVRFQAEVRARKRDVAEAEYVATVLMGLAMTGFLGSVAMAIASFMFPPRWWNNSQIAVLLLPVSAFIMVRALDSGVSNLFRAQQRSVAFNVYAVAKKYVVLATALGVMFFLFPRLEGFYIGTFAAEVATTLIAAAYLWRAHHASIRGFSTPLFKAMLIFGVPMIAFEISGIVLNLGDRYVIQALLGSDALGQYSAAYNLCEYLQTMLMASLVQAISPIYLRMWEDEGAAATRVFVERALRFYVMAGAAVLAGVSAVGADALVLLASEKYRAGAVVIPYVVAGMLLSGAIPIFAAGIYIHKQNHLMIPCVLASAVLNIALNIWLVPIMGLKGAGVATLVSYVFVATCCWLLGLKRFSISLPWLEILKFGLIAFVMYWIVTQVSTVNPVLTLIFKMAMGTLTYSLAVLACDAEARKLVKKAWLPRLGRL